MADEERFIEPVEDDASAPIDHEQWLKLDPRVLPLPDELMRAPRTSDEEIITADEPAVASERSDDERIERIAAELDMAFDKLRPIGHGITVFGSARTLDGTAEYALARSVGRAIGDCGLPVITGGGPGAMEGANRGAAEAGARSVGLRIELPFEPGINEWVDLDVLFHYFFTRKVCFVRYAAAFVVLPGGYGTLDELFETLCLIQTDKVQQRPVLLMGAEFWEGMLDWTRDQLAGRGLISPTDLDLLRVVDDVDEVARICCQASEAVGRRVD